MTEAMFDFMYMFEHIILSILYFLLCLVALNHLRRN